MDAYQDLVFSLNLNIAAYALKLHNFDRAMTLCSLVLEFDPNNVKTLFRKVLAAREFGISNAAYLKLAYHDLVKATKNDENNIDIRREFQVARDDFFTRTKRKFERPDDNDRDNKGKKSVVADDCESSCSRVSSVVGVHNTTVVECQGPVN